MRRLLTSVLAVALSAAPLAAQGSLSLMGFGYPVGQSSSRTAGTAGALGEFDAGSPINPASLLAAGRSIFSFQVDPEYRKVVVNGRTVNTTTARFPVISVGTRVGTRGFIGISFATLLDRTWDATYPDSVVVGGDRVASTVTAQLRGAINDTRLAAAFQVSERVQVGLAIHAVTGANRMHLARTFTDSLTFGPLSQLTTLAYTGSAISLGVVASPAQHLYVGASLRLGEALKTRLDDSVSKHALVPNRVGASVSYDGIPGTLFALRVNHESWSRMRALGTAALDVHDVTELSAGVDVSGPKLQGFPVQFRAGARSRDLPFGLNGNTVTERTLALGSGLTFARGWASLDLGVQRINRKAGGLSEQGTSISVGLTVRP